MGRTLVAHMRQGGTGDNSHAQSSVAVERSATARAAAADSSWPCAARGGAPRPKPDCEGKIVSAGRYGVSRRAGTTSFALMIIVHMPAVTRRGP